MHRVNSGSMSLTSRVMLFVALAITLCLMTLGAVVERSINNHFAEQDAEELQAVADAVQSVLRRHESYPHQLPSALAGAVSGHHGVYFQVSEGDGSVIYALPGINLKMLTKTQLPGQHISRANLYTWHEADRMYRGALTKLSTATQDFIITTAIDMGFHDQFMSEFRQTLWTIMTVIGFLTLLAAWLGVRQGHMPLRALSRNIRDIQSDRLQTRLDPLAVPMELRELVLSFNQMIGQLEEGFERLSHFSADIAHELRTPLTNLITQTQVALSSSRTPGEYRDLLYSNLEEQERLARMVIDMLWLAQTDRGLIKPVFGSLNLADEILAIFDFFEAWADENRVSLVLDGSAAMVQGDRSMLRRALSNLLSNAIRHTTAGGTITVSIAQVGESGVEIAVQNPGVDIPSEHMLRIFDRFYRADPSRKSQNEGAGLGLAIVRSIIEAHEGTITARSAEGVTTFHIILPVLTAQQLP